MAITRLKYGDYECWIEIDKKEVDHYSIETNPETPTVTCWIASEENKNFRICGRKAHKLHDISMKVVVDGTNMPPLAIVQDDTGISHKRGVRSRQSGNIRLFQFARLQVTDDETTLEESLSRDIGEICVHVHRASHKVKIESRDSRGTSTGEGLFAAYTVHERSKKALPHRVQCTTEVEYKGTTYLTTNYEVVATFIFRYRSLEMLRANEIVPQPTPQVQTPAPPVPRKRKAPEVKEEEEDDDELELEQAKRKVDDLLMEVSRLKAVIDAKQPKRKRVKAEPKPTFVSGEVIDLT